MCQGYQIYKPVYRIGNRAWKKIPRFATITHDEGCDLEIKFYYMFHLQKRGEKTQFAFTYPYSYNKCQQDLLKTEISSLNQTNVYFHKELLIKSKEGRNIDLITISSYDKIR